MKYKKPIENPLFNNWVNPVISTNMIGLTLTNVNRILIQKYKKQSLPNFIQFLGDTCRKENL